jgi:hypothetical protein
VAKSTMHELPAWRGPSPLGLKAKNKGAPRPWAHTTKSSPPPIKSASHPPPTKLLISLLTRLVWGGVIVSPMNWRGRPGAFGGVLGPQAYL